MKVEVEGSSGRTLTLEDGLLAADLAELSGAGTAPPPARVAFAAAHVVMRDEYAAVAHTPETPGTPAELAAYIDWEGTRSLRERLDGLGLGIAEAMDTAQRFELGWANAERLIRECGALAPANGFIAGAGIDHLERPTAHAELVEGVVHQAELIRECGGLPIVLPLEPLARQRATPDDYVRVYAEIVRRASGPLLVHWLGEMFHPGLKGYFPGDSFERVMALDREQVVGVKLSLLDAGMERRVRRALLPHGQLVLTGDDYHFGELVLGGDAGNETPPPVTGERELLGRTVPLGDFSHALLGVLDAVAEPAAVALAWLARGEGRRYLARMRPCEALGQELFRPPTAHYKAGLARLAWLNGLQGNPLLPNHLERARDAAHYERCTELASAAGALRDAPEAARRLASSSR